MLSTFPPGETLFFYLLRVPILAPYLALFKPAPGSKFKPAPDPQD